MSDISISTIHNDKNAEALFYHDKCDKYDYLLAAGCGVIAGLTDIFLVDTPKDSKLQQLTDA